MCSEFSIKIGDVNVLTVVVHVIESALDILTLKQAENDDIGYAMLPCVILIIFLFLIHWLLNLIYV